MSVPLETNAARWMLWFTPGDVLDVRSALVVPAGVSLSLEQTPASLHILHALGFCMQGSTGKMRGLAAFSFLPGITEADLPECRHPRLSGVVY